MTKELIINAAPQGVEIALLEDKKLVELRSPPKRNPTVKAIRKAYGELNEEALVGLKKADRAAFVEQLMAMVENLRPAGPPVPVTNKRVHA